MKTADQLRAARAMVRLEQAELAKRAGISVETIKRLESLPGALQAQALTIRKIETVLELAGVEFLDEPPVGVRRRGNKHEALIAILRDGIVDAVEIALRANLHLGKERSQIIEGVIATFSKLVPEYLEDQLPEQIPND